MYCVREDGLQLGCRPMEYGLWLSGASGERKFTENSGEAFRPTLLPIGPRFGAHVKVPPGKPPLSNIDYRKSIWIV